MLEIVLDIQVGDDEMSLVHVRHADLEQDPEAKCSKFIRKCPKCKDGWLLVGRDAATFVIEPYDVCRLCGQLYWYDDYEDLRKDDWAK